MAAVITASSTSITINGPYKSFTSTTGSTSTVIQYGSGEAPASGDAGRFLMWRDTTTLTGTWQIRYIESATATTVTVGDGGFSSAPGTGESFYISTNLADIETAVPTACTSQGNQYSFNGRDWNLQGNAFLGDVDKALTMEASLGLGWQMALGTAVQFGRLLGGEANDSVETTQGCHLTFKGTRFAVGDVYSSTNSRDDLGPVVNYYGCLVESSVQSASQWRFQRMRGPGRFIGCIFDGPLGGRFYHEASEWVSCRMSGNTSLTVAWSIGATFTRDISDIVFYNGLAAMKNFLTFGGTVRNTTFTSSLTDVFRVEGSVGSVFNFVDCTTFGDGDINDFGSGIINQQKSINYTVADSSGTGLTGAKVAVYDTDGTIQTGIQTSSAGAVSEILAKFFIWTDNSPSADKSPFDIRVRKYDYVFQDFSSAVAEPIKQELRLPDNTVTVLSEAAAAALTGIAIDFVAETVTVTQARTLSQIYDYCQSQLALDANMDEPEFIKSTDGNTFTFHSNWSLVIGAGGDITSASGKAVAFAGTGELVLQDAGNNVDGLTVNGDMSVDALIGTMNGVTVTGAVDYSNAGTYILQAVTFNEVTNSSGGAVTLETDANTTITTNTGPNITINAPKNTVSITGIVNGSRLRIYNNTTLTEVYNGVPGTTYNELYDEGTNYSEGDSIDIRVTYQNGVTAKLCFSTSAVAGASGWSAVVSQVDDDVYIAYGIDGSTVTGFSADYVNDEVDITVAADFSAADLYAWWAFNLTTSQGISDFCGGLVALDQANLRINNDTVNIYVDNTTATNLKQTDNIRIFRVDEAYPVKSSGGGGIDVVWRDRVYLAETGVSGLTSAESTQLFAAALQSTLLGVEGDVTELHQLQGLDAANPMTVTPVSRVAGSIDLAITGDGVTTTTVTRQP